MDKKFNVFHGLVNYGTQSGFFVSELRRQGIAAVSVTGYDRFDRMTDITLKNNGRNFCEKFYNATWNSLFKLKCFFSYDIFHFYFGTTLFPQQLDLPLYKFFGKKVIMHYLGNDVQGYKKSVEKYKWTNMPGFIGENDPLAYDLMIEKRLTFESRFVDLQFVCAPCYAEFVPNSKVLPLAIDLSSYTFSEPKQHDRLIILHAPTNRGFKGSDYIISAIEKLIDEGFPIKIELIENATHQELKEKYAECDIFIDQIMAGWYGTAAIEAMAIGRPVICAIRPEYFKYIDYAEDIPIIHADPESIYSVLKDTVLYKEKLSEVGLKSRQFVEKVHDVRKLTKDLIFQYKKLN